MSTAFVVQTFGVPTFGSVTEKAPSEKFTESRAVWSFRHALLACDFDGGQLWAFTVISRDRWFRPRLEPLTNGQVRGRLGKDTFGALVDGMPQKVANHHGASTINYAEHHYFGRPGAYFDYVLNASSFSVPSPHPLGFMVDGDSYEGMETAIEAYRVANKPNALTVSAGQRGGGWWFNRILMDEIEQASMSPVRAKT